MNNQIPWIDLQNQFQNIGKPIEPIWWPFPPIPGTEQPTKNLNNENFDELNKEPNKTSWWQIIGKMFIGLVVGWIIATLLFIVLSFVGSMITDALQQESMNSNPLLPILLLFIWFLWSFIWNMAVALVYNLFYSKKYYNTSKMLWFILLSNTIILFVLAPLYLIFSKQIEVLFLILGFHVLFSVFISSNQIDFISNPNYAWSALMWNTLWFAVAMLAYGIIHKIANISAIQQQVYLLMGLPSILWFMIIPFCASIREKIYYKFYEMWNNAFYIPSISEIVKDEDDESESKNEEIHVDM